MELTDLIAILILCGTLWLIVFLDKLEIRLVQSILNWIPPVLLAYIVPAGLSVLCKQDFSKIVLHRINSTYLVPFAVVMVMSTFKLSQLKLIGFKPLVVFISGSFWIAVFPVLYFGISDYLHWDFLTHKELVWKAIPPIVGSWIGGSASQIVLKELVECPENLFVSVLVLDNVLVNIWTICMFQFIKRSDRLDRWLGISTTLHIQKFPENITVKMNGFKSIIILLIIVLIISFVSMSLVQRIILLSSIGFLLPYVFKNWNADFLLKHSSIPIVCIMIILGFKLRFEQVFFQSGFIVFLIIWLLGHLAFMTLITRLVKSHAVWISIGSMANVGGISTAPAVTSVYDKELMPYAIVLAVISMVTGTVWGGVTIWLFRHILAYV